MNVEVYRTPCGCAGLLVEDGGGLCAVEGYTNAYTAAECGGCEARGGCALHAEDWRISAYHYVDGWDAAFAEVDGWEADLRRAAA